MKKGLLYFAWLVSAAAGAFTFLSGFVPYEQITEEVQLNLIAVYLAMSLVMPPTFWWLYKDTPPSE